MTPVRLTVVLTHPIQYYAPWFRHVTRHAPEIALTVVHATQPTPEQQGVGFDRPFTWDVDLFEGYESTVVRGAKADDRVDSAHFRGLDVPEIGDAIARTSPDVVLITGWYSITLMRALWACRRRGIPVLYRGDSHLLSGPRGWRRPVWAARTWFLLRQFDGFLSPGSRVREYLRWFGVPEHRIFDVPHGIDNDMFAERAAALRSPAARAAVRAEWHIAADAFVPLFVGKLVPSKRPINVVKAAARLGPRVTLLVAGSGPLERDVREEAASLGVDLRLIGFLNQTELPRAYAAADCLALPSDFPETWGLVVNEALATGLPAVVSSAVGCAPDLIDEGETGYTYPLGDIELLAERFETIRRRRAEGHDWTAACRAKIDRFSYARMTEGLVRACRSVIRRSPGPEPRWEEAPHRILALCGLMVIAGGLERMVFRTLAAARDRGARAHCIVNGWENFRITPLAEDAGATWSVGPYWYTITRHHLTPSKIARMLVEVGRVSWHALREARRIHATHVLLSDHLSVIRNAPALLWLRMCGVRVVITLQNAPAHGRFYRTLWRWIVDPLVDDFVCNSAFTRRELLAHDLAPAKVRVIPNVAAPHREEWHGEAARLPGRIIYVGQIIPEKGLDRLLDAVALLRAERRDVTLDVVGTIDGWESPAHEGYHARIRERAGRADLAGAVTFLGWREDVPELMARASIHCCPSLPEIREAFGLVVLEAKTSGMPSVVTPSGYLPELVDHRVDGWVCADATAAAIADGLRYFVEDRDRVLEAGRAAQESARAFSPDRYSQAWEEVFA